MNTDAHPHPSIFWPARVDNPPLTCLPDTLNICQLGPPAERLSVFWDIDAVKAHMHLQCKLGPKSKKVSNHQSTKCYTKFKIPRTDQGRHCRERHKQYVLEKYKCHLWRKEKRHALPHRFGIPKACRSVQPYRRPTKLPHLPEARQHLPHAVRL